MTPRIKLGARMLAAALAAAVAGSQGASPAFAQAERQITAQQAAVAAVEAPASQLALDVWTNRPDGRYLPGETVSLYIRTNADVRVVVMNVDAMGRTNVLLPNAFTTESALAGNTVHQLPPAGATYQFTVAEPFGSNLIKVVASTGSHPILDRAALRADSGPFPEVAGSAEELARSIQAVMVEQAAASWAVADVFVDVVAERPGAQEPAAPAFGLSLSLDRPAYRVGDTVTATLTAERDCTLTLVNINEAINEAVVLYPNQAVPSVRLRAGQPASLPGIDSAVRLAVVGPAGSQRMIAICTEEDRPLLGDLAAYPMRAIHPVLTTAQWDQLPRPPMTARASLRFEVMP